MKRPKVKICGITNLDDALAAVDCGADYLGFIFVRKSPRCVEAEVVAAIVRKLPARVGKVGVFVNRPPDQVTETLEACGLDIAQLHGEETKEEALFISVARVWKTFHLAQDEDLQAAKDFPAGAVLVDTMLPGQRGGTGLVGNWRLAAKLAAGRNLILAGGIKPENVVDAVKTVSPYAIDVGSGVESQPGRKDPRRLSCLFKALEQGGLSG